MNPESGLQLEQSFTSGISVVSESPCTQIAQSALLEGTATAALLDGTIQEMEPSKELNLKDEVQQFIAAYMADFQDDFSKLTQRVRLLEESMLKVQNSLLIRNEGPPSSTTLPAPPTPSPEVSEAAAAKTDAHQVEPSRRFDFNEAAVAPKMEMPLLCAACGEKRLTTSSPRLLVQDVRVDQREGNANAPQTSVSPVVRANLQPKTPHWPLQRSLSAPSTRRLQQSLSTGVLSPGVPGHRVPMPFSEISMVRTMSSGNLLPQVSSVTRTPPVSPSLVSALRPPQLMSVPQGVHKMVRARSAPSGVRCRQQLRAQLAMQPQTLQHNAQVQPQSQSQPQPQTQLLAQQVPLPLSTHGLQTRPLQQQLPPQQQQPLIAPVPNQTVPQLQMQRPVIKPMPLQPIIHPAELRFDISPVPLGQNEPGHSSSPRGRSLVPKPLAPGADSSPPPRTPQIGYPVGMSFKLQPGPLLPGVRLPGENESNVLNDSRPPSPPKPEPVARTPVRNSVSLFRGARILSGSEVEGR